MPMLVKMTSFLLQRITVFIKKINYKYNILYFKLYQNKPHFSCKNRLFLQIMDELPDIYVEKTKHTDKDIYA